MRVKYITPLQQTDPEVCNFFVRILNLILYAPKLEYTDNLLESEDIMSDGQLSSLFRWNTDTKGFSLWQRIAPGSLECFENPILEINFFELLFQDGKPDQSTSN